jgi:hypothetical protein
VADHVAFAGFAAGLEQFVVQYAKEGTLIDDLGTDEGFSLGSDGLCGFLVWLGGLGLFKFGGGGGLGLLGHARVILLRAVKEKYMREPHGTQGMSREAIDDSGLISEFESAWHVPLTMRPHGQRGYYATPKDREAGRECSDLGRILRSRTRCADLRMSKGRVDGDTPDIRKTGSSDGYATPINSGLTKRK